MVIEGIAVLAIAAVLECVCGYVIGVMAKARCWTLNRTYWLCWAVGVLGACAPSGITRRFLPPQTAGFLSGLSVGMSLLVWSVCARTAGFRFNQMNEEQHELTTLRLSDRGPR
jgi:uncharacterized membrane protein YoaK (UPF0700 family)